MQKKDVGIVSWFNFDNYKDCENFTALDWSNEILQRILLHIKCFNDGSFYDEKKKISSIDSQDAINQIESIKKFGLFKNSNLYKNEVGKQRVLHSLQDTKKERYLDDITEFDAYKFLHSSRNKHKIEKDMDILADNFISFERNKDMEMLFEEYQSPFSNIENANDDYGTRYLRVNLDCTDESLQNLFLKWLNIQRSEFPFSQKNIKTPLFTHWNAQRLLAYWDVITVLKHEGNSMTNNALGELIFFDEFDVVLEERIAKTTDPNAKKMISFETLDILYAQAHSEL
ncbi:MAG: DUF6387 family protein [Methylotenera sp.]|nr:DUF6387 family protein [Methylotenera sp.]MDO9479790.1 DUF6387 family protein [Hydrogenophaga sp.]